MYIYLTKSWNNKKFAHGRKYNVFDIYDTYMYVVGISKKVC